jgi:hypothetical protein
MSPSTALSAGHLASGSRVRTQRSLVWDTLIVSRLSASPAESTTHVADNLVDTGADTLGELDVVERGRVRVSFYAFLVAYPIELIGGDTWSDVSGRSVQDFSRQLFVRPSHLAGW